MVSPAASTRGRSDASSTQATTEETAEAADPLAVGDAVAAKALEALAPLRFDEAAGEQDRLAGYRLRFDAVLERDLAASSIFPDGLERDEFDQRAAHVIGWDGDEAIATCRVVFPVPGEPLPVERASGVALRGCSTPADSRVSCS